VLLVITVSVYEGHLSGDVLPVGRDHERRFLAFVWASTCDGDGRLVLVGGEAGIGKTTLVEHFVAGLQDPERIVITGACYDVDSPPPYAPWREMLSAAQRYADQFGLNTAEWFGNEYLSSLPDQRSLFADVQQRLELLAQFSPVLLVLEDLHWADRESLELLRFIARSLKDTPVCVIATYRNDEISTDRPLYHSLPHLVREARADRLDLRRFPGSVIRQLIERRYGFSQRDCDRLVDELKRRTEGNPFFIVELLRSMEMADILYQEDGEWRITERSGVEIPLLVRQMIDRRLQQLTPDAREVLQTAAILGYDVRPDVLVSVTEKEPDELSAFVQQAVDAFLIEQPRGWHQFRFRHALIQEALYFSTPLLWRQAQHCRIGEKLAEKSDADPAIVAQHFRYGRDARAAPWSLQSARQGRRLYAPHAVIQQLTPVLDNPEILSAEERIEAFRLRGWAFEMTGAFHEADSDYLAELRAARETNDRNAERDALVRLAELWTYRDYQRVGEYVEQALQATEEMNDHSLLAHSHNRFGTWHLSQDNPRKAREHHERALEIGQQTSNQLGIAESRDLLGLALTLSGDLVGAARQYQQARSQLHLLNGRRSLANCCANFAHLGPTYLADTTVAAASLEDCIRSGQHGLEIASEIDYRSGEVYARVRLIACLGAQGAYQQALDMVQRSIADAEEIENRQLLSAAHAMASLLWLDLLDPDMAFYHAERARTLAEQIGSMFRVRMGLAIFALSAIARGELDTAMAEFKRARFNGSSPQTLSQNLLWRARIELELARGNPENALSYIDSLLHATPHASRQCPAIRTSFLRGRALNRLERLDEAESWLVPAREVAQELGALGLLWRIQNEIGLLHLGRGDRINASRAFADARRMVSDIGDSLDDTDVRSRFRNAAISQIPSLSGPTTLQAAKHSSGGLTRRQRQVARLIASGKTNRAVADALSISERTVESHVSAILAALDLESRAQIVAWSIEHGLTGNTSFAS
jgi:DNA-binding CsgD family transcriptional regulator/tetratricopeptide (TPR) repeat protein